jgi:hypothetical protein
VGYDAVQSVGSKLTFRGNISRTPSGLRISRSRRRESRWKAELYFQRVLSQKINPFCKTYKSSIFNLFAENVYKHCVRGIKMCRPLCFVTYGPAIFDVQQENFLDFNLLTNYSRQIMTIAIVNSMD